MQLLFAAIFVVQPPTLKNHPSFEAASGLPVRAQRNVEWVMPAARKTAWAAFTAEAGGDWQVYWDAETGVPGRIFGAGIPAPGVMKSDAAAERFARAFLSRHIDLLAPGSQPTDFALVSNRVDDGMRTVGFEQYHAGLRVLDGQVSFRFKNDRLFVIGSEALPDVTAHAVTARATAARSLAQAWIGDDFGTQAAVLADDPKPVILALVRGKGAIEYRVVTRVTVDAPRVPGRFDVFLDAETGTPVGRRQTLRFSTGTLQFNVPDRWYGATRQGQPARLDNLTVDGVAVATDASGVFNFASATSASVTPTLSGTVVSIQNAGGALATANLSVSPSGTAVWDLSSDEFGDAQLTAFIATETAKRWIKVVDPAFTWADGNSIAEVNVNQTCNANSDGQNTHFFRAGASRTGNLNCGNTGRITDVVYHETGHSIHNHTIIQGVGSEGDGSLGEGQADYVAMTITNDHAMGLGFFVDTPNMALRDSDPPDREYKWPDDIGEIHATGMIFSGAMWDLRKALIAKLGMTAGVAHSDHLFHEALRRAVDIPSTYAEIVAADDDDGNLANGTPNLCEINGAFAPHGLVPPSGDLGVVISLPTRDGFKITVNAAPSAICRITNVQSMKLSYQVRGMAATAGMADMTAAGNDWSATIPSQPDGTVMNYAVDVTLANGTLFHFPSNLADPMYEMYVGTVHPIYCTDFEGAAEPAGWTHGVTKGTQDQWQWGVLQSQTSSPDPKQAFSGSKVYGQDLGGATDNGAYVSDTTSFLQSPMIDTMGYQTVRLQYRRWLTCEQGFYDHANIYANGTQLWTNPPDGMNGSKHMLDAEWRFQDLDLTPTVANGKVQVKFELASDPGLEFGGWTIDDFCIVGIGGGPPMPDGGAGSGGGSGGAGGSSGMNADSGCGCQVGRKADSPSAGLLIALILLIRGRRGRAAARSARRPASAAR